MKVLRLLLGVYGIVSLAVWIGLVAMAWLFWGMKAGGPRGGPSVLQAAYCALSPMAAFAYYLRIADGNWTRRLLFGGIVVHVVLLMAIALLVATTDGGRFLALWLLIGPSLWMAYVLGQLLRRS